MESFKFTIVTPEALVFDERVDGVNVPGAEGRLGILAHHAPLIAAVKAGVVSLQMGEAQRFFAVGESFVEVRDNVVTLLADSAVEAPSQASARKLLIPESQLAPDQRPSSSTLVFD
ncbi:MAG TPA: ATP synthase F1 subunit epsilon [Kiritimatiellia bacterium]|nr:ATP synthase F1 subunit epsilon [Kiritimatiellia bacterium]